MKIVQAAEEGPFDIVVKDSNDNEFKKKRKIDAKEDDEDDGKGVTKRQRPDSSSEGGNFSMRCSVL